MSRPYFNCNERLEIFLTCFCNILCYVGYYFKNTKTIPKINFSFHLGHRVSQWGVLGISTPMSDVEWRGPRVQNLRRWYFANTHSRTYDSACAWDSWICFAPLEPSRFPLPLSLSLSLSLSPLHRSSLFPMNSSLSLILSRIFSSTSYFLTLAALLHLQHPSPSRLPPNVVVSVVFVVSSVVVACCCRC